jgi:hypothetical protein
MLYKLLAQIITDHLICITGDQRNDVTAGFHNITIELSYNVVFTCQWLDTGFGWIIGFIECLHL